MLTGTFRRSTIVYAIVVQCGWKSFVVFCPSREIESDSNFIFQLINETSFSPSKNKAEKEELQGARRFVAIPGWF